MNTRLVRLVPLAGIAYLVLEVAGNGSIGSFPDGDATIGKLFPFYAKHHSGIERGGVLLHYAAIALALLGVALWTRLRESGANSMLSAVALIGAVVATVDELSGAAVYSTLGFIGGKEQVIAPAALQAWHVNGAGGGAITGDGGLALLLVAVAIAGISARAVPKWLAWSALPLGLLQLTPLGFYAELVFWLWAAAAGSYLALRPRTA